MNGPWLEARSVPPDEVLALQLPAWPEGGTDGLVLVCDTGGLYLELRAGRRKTRLAIDFRSGVLQHRARISQARSEMLVRACGVPNDGSAWRVVDATAGLGRDAFLLAVCGADVTLLERQPVLALLLAEALQALAADHADVAMRLHLVTQDARDFLAAVPASARPEVVYCDPMFPPRGKSAAVGGDMQVLHALVGETPDAGELLAAALRVATRRVVVKRPLRADPVRATGLDHIHPSYALAGRAARFDVYLVPTLPL